MKICFETLVASETDLPMVAVGATADRLKFVTKYTGKK